MFLAQKPAKCSFATAGVILLAGMAAASGPPPPPVLNGVGGPHLATLTWQVAAPNVNNGQPISGYQIFRATSPAGPFTEIFRFYAPVPGGFTDGSATGFLDATASPAFGNSYTYFVRVAD